MSRLRMRALPSTPPETWPWRPPTSTTTSASSASKRYACVLHRPLKRFMNDPYSISDKDICANVFLLLLWCQGGERYKFPNPNPFVEEDTEKSEVASVAYRFVLNFIKWITFTMKFVQFFFSLLFFFFFICSFKSGLTCFVAEYTWCLSLKLCAV